MKNTIIKKLSITLLVLFFSTSILSASEESDIKFGFAMDLYKNGKIPESLKVANEAISIDSNNSIYYTFMGNIYKQIKQYDESEQNFRKALKINSKDGGALNGLAGIFSHMGQSTQAIKYYKKALRNGLDYYGVYVNIGHEYLVLYEKSGKVKHLFFSKENLEKAIKLNEKAYDAHSYLGKVFINSYDYDSAIESLKKSIKYASESRIFYGDLSGVYYDLASAYYNKKRYGEAVKACKESLEILPNIPDAVFLMGVSYAYLGNEDEAVKQYHSLAIIDKISASTLLEVINKKF